jgi:hypothetical protein
MGDIGFVVVEIINAEAEPDCLGRIPVHPCVNDQILALITIGVSPHEAEQIRVWP